MLDEALTGICLGVINTRRKMDFILVQLKQHHVSQACRWKFKILFFLRCNYNIDFFIPEYFRVYKKEFLKVINN